MKRELPQTIDLDFLSHVAEAGALSSKATAKRVKPSLAASDAGEVKPQVKGAYLAALRGDDTPGLWPREQRKFVGAGSQVKVVAADGANASGDRLGLGGGGGGVPPPPRTPARFKHGDRACFKCGTLGHWGRDFDGAPIGGGTQSQSSEPRKACRCGLGDCLVLTANTGKNKGRRFYKCPVREENGGCGFFEWCDNASGAAYIPNLSSDSRSSSQFPDILCPCGAGPCLILTARTGINAGQQLYRCPQRRICGFFGWCNDYTTAGSLPASAGEVHDSFNFTSTKSYKTASRVLSCFKCGQGHWAANCPSSGSCYKCGNAGHLPKDCLVKTMWWGCQT